VHSSAVLGTALYSHAVLRCHNTVLVHGKIPQTGLGPHHNAGQRLELLGLLQRVPLQVKILQLVARPPDCRAVGRVGQVEGRGQYG
jgi:hypothetical protein